MNVLHVMGTWYPHGYKSDTLGWHNLLMKPSKSTSPGSSTRSDIENKHIKLKLINFIWPFSNWMLYLSDITTSLLCLKYWVWMMKLLVVPASFDLIFSKSFQEFYFIFERPTVSEYHKSEQEIIMINVESYNYR